MAKQQDIANKIYVDPTEEQSQKKLSHHLLHLIKRIDKPYEKIAIVCIGTDRVIGDSYGPLVGFFLKDKLGVTQLDIYGTLSQTVNALNLEETLTKIDKENTLVIALDASIGKEKKVGCIAAGYGSILPGQGVGKDLPPVGDIYIKAIVSANSVFHSIRLSAIYDMAECTAHAISKVSVHPYLRFTLFKCKQKFPVLLREYLRQQFAFFKPVRKVKG